MPDSYQFSERVTGKFILHADLATVSPVLIGSGEGEEADIEIIRLPDGQPYIPGSSFTGALQNYFSKWKVAPGAGDNKFNASASVFWGTEQKKKFDAAGSVTNNTEPSFQSHIVIDDLHTTMDVATHVVRRDGIKIKPETGTALSGAKYDFEILEPEVTFHLRAEVTLRQQPDTVADFKNYLTAIGHILHDDSFRIGAQTNNGFGQVKCTGFKVWQFTFKEDSESWFSYLNNFKLPNDRLLSPWDKEYYTIEPQLKPVMDWTSELPENTFSERPKDLTINAEFKLKSSLIIGSYSKKVNVPDKVHLTSVSGRHIVTGKAIKGALWHRGLKILRTLNVPDARSELEQIMGFVDEKPRSGTAKKGARKGILRIDETEIAGGEKMAQTRIKIDRFTGGTISGALFNSEPVWRGENTKIHIGMSLKGNFEDEKHQARAILLMHLLKDMWTEDLPIGGEKNVGRGVLSGTRAVVKYGNERLELSGNGEYQEAQDSNTLLPQLADWEKAYKKCYKIN